MNRLLEQLRSQYGELVHQYDDVLDRCANEARDPSEVEAGVLEGLRGEMEPLGERIVQLRDTDARRLSTMTALADFPATGDDGSVMPASTSGPESEGQVQHTRAELPPLAMGETQLRSLMAAVAAHQPWSENLVMTRAAITTPVGSVVGTWSYPSVPSGREERIAADLMNRGADGSTINYLAVTAPAVAADVAEGAPKPDAGAVVGRRSAPVEKGACYSDVSTEIFADFQDAQNLVNSELLGSLVTWENGKVVAGITGDAGVLTPVLASTSRLLAVLEAMQAVRSGPARRQCDLVIVNPGDLISLWGEQDTVGALMAGPAIVTLPTGELVLWGAKLRQTVELAAGKVLVGQAADASFWTREPANVRLDPFSQSASNLVRVIAEERANVQPTTPQAWAYASLPVAAGVETAKASGGK
jgi:hypothetical protein